MTSPVSRAIASRSDVEEARRETRAAMCALGFGSSEAEAVVLAVSELATNLVRYAHNGRITIDAVSMGLRSGVIVQSIDGGPGIADVHRALTDGFSTGDGLGSGLPAVRRLMDEFEIVSGPDGTHIRACKWLRS